MYSLSGTFSPQRMMGLEKFIKKTAVPKIEIIFRRHRIVTNIVRNCIGVTPTKKLQEEKNCGVTKEV